MHENAGKETALIDDETAQYVDLRNKNK